MFYLEFLFRGYFSQSLAGKLGKPIMTMLYIFIGIYDVLLLWEENLFTFQLKKATNIKMFSDGF